MPLEYTVHVTVHSLNLNLLCATVCPLTVVPARYLTVDCSYHCTLAWHTTDGDRLPYIMLLLLAHK